MTARRAQKPIHFRSDKAAAILARHVRPGRSQAAVIEEALEKLDPDATKRTEIEERIRRIKAIISKVDKSLALTMAEFDALEYDEFGSPR
jgi:hypothetical protein